MQLAGELGKMNLASLIRLVRNSELTGKVCLTQGVNTAFIFFEHGQPVHVESDYGTGRDALLELFLWQSGTFSYIEEPLNDIVRSLSSEEPLERLLKEGLSFQESFRYLEQLRVSGRTVLRATELDPNDALLSMMDGRRELAEIVQLLGLSRSEYVANLQKLMASGKALVVEVPPAQEGVQLPDWVMSRLKQDNPNVSQAIVDLVIWADRLKCWLFQADVDMERVIWALSGGAEQNAEAVYETSYDEPDERFDPGPQQPAADESAIQQTVTNEDIALEQPGTNQAEESSLTSTKRALPRPPSYEF